MSVMIRCLIIFGMLFHVMAYAVTDNNKEWKALFNGKSLQGWTPKFSGYALGENYKNTFKVVDGLLTVDYSNYEKFDGEFGHLFYKVPYSHYILRTTYRFLDRQIPLAKGMGWAYRNNGLMIHSQSPESMEVDQKFPTSIEVQLLSGFDGLPRTNANICTPDSHVEIAGKLVTQHCIKSISKTYAGSEWVTVEVEVRGNEVIRHYVNGELVIEYNNPQLDDVGFAKLGEQYGGKAMKAGYIALQAETHPTQFKSIEIKVLDH